MDVSTLATAFDAISIVAWFVFLIVVFAVFVGIGIYQGRRNETLQCDPAELPRVAARRTPARVHQKVHQKEFT